MKKVLAMLLVTLMLAGMCTAFAGDDVLLIAPAPKTAALQIEGVEGNVYYGEVALEEGATALSILEKVLTEAKVDYVVQDSQYGGKVLHSVGEDVYGQFGGYDGWMYFVDDESPMVSADAYVLQGGETVRWAYGDMGVLLPILDVYRDHNDNVNVTVAADVTTYEESNNWEPVTTRQPVAGAKVTVDGVAYVTDEEGAVKLSAEASAKAAVSVQVEKETEDGLPLVVRLAPEYTVALTGLEVRMPYSDLVAGEWYTEPVLKMSDLGVVNGFPGGAFRPTVNVTRAQAATMLWRLAGAPQVNAILPFSDVAEGEWYTEAVRWAAALGITNGSDGKFLPDADVSRQDLAVMLVRYQKNVVKTELPAGAEAPAFSDNADIADYAAEAVYLLQKAGIVTGTDGKFLPAAAASRGELCKMLAGLVVAD